jgi:Tfp pilus assembly protein PilZ
MKSPGFNGNRTQTRIMQFLAIGGIAIATVHMFRIADDIAEILTELWGLA